MLGHGGIPLTGIADGELLASLLKDITDLLLISEITDTLGTDDILGPTTGNKIIKQREIHRGTTVIDKGANAILLYLSSIVMMMVVMVMMMVMMVVVVPLGHVL